MPRRREFVRDLTLVTTALSAWRCAGGGPTSPLTPPLAEPVTVLVPLMAVGQTVAASGGGVNLAVTRRDDTSVVAVSRTCTHQGCTVLLPSAPGGTLDCPCHGSRFQTTGALVNGPARLPLPSYPARIDGGQVVVTVG